MPMGIIIVNNIPRNKKKMADTIQLTDIIAPLPFTPSTGTSWTESIHTTTYTEGAAPRNPLLSEQKFRWE